MSGIAYHLGTVDFNFAEGTLSHTINSNMVSLSKLDSPPEVATEFQPYSLPFVEVRRWQNNSAFATKDFKLGDTVLEESPMLLYYEHCPNPLVDDFLRILKLEKQRLMEQGETSLPSNEFFSPLLVVQWQNLTCENIEDILKLFYCPSSQETEAPDKQKVREITIHICGVILPLLSKHFKCKESLFRYITRRVFSQKKLVIRKIDSGIESPYF